MQQSNFCAELRANSFHSIVQSLTTPQQNECIERSQSLSSTSSASLRHRLSKGGCVQIAPVQVPRSGYTQLLHPMLKVIRGEHYKLRSLACTHKHKRLPSLRPLATGHARAHACARAEKFAGTITGASLRLAQRGIFPQGAHACGRCKALLLCAMEEALCEGAHCLNTCRRYRHRSTHSCTQTCLGATRRS